MAVSFLLLFSSRYDQSNHIVYSQLWVGHVVLHDLSVLL